METLKLGIEWDVEQTQLESGLKDSKKVIMGTAETIEDVQRRVTQNISSISKQAEDELERLHNRANQIRNGLSRWADPKRSTLGLSADDPSFDKYKKELADIEAQIHRIKNAPIVPKDLNPLPDVVNKSKSSFNGLQNSINQISRELPAFTYSAQTGFMAISNNIPTLVDEIGKLRKENEALVASGQKGKSIWGQLAGSFLSFNTLISVGITLMTVYGKEIGSFFMGLLSGKNKVDTVKESVKMIAASMGEAGAAAAKATLEVEGMKRKFDQARSGIVSKDKALKTYNEGLGKVLGTTKDLNTAEERTLKNGGAYIELMFKKAKAAAMMKLYTEQMSKAAEEMAKTDEQSVSYISSGYINSADPRLQELYRADAEKNRKEAAKIFVDRGDSIKKMWLDENDDIEQFIKTNGLKIDDTLPKDDKAGEHKLAQILSSRKDALKKIADLDNEYRVMSFSDDEREIEALKQKFADFRKVIEEENDKIRKHNASKDKSVPLIDVSLVDPIETRAFADTRYRQATENDVKILNEQKAKYFEYEQYKTETSEREANKRFALELAGVKSFYSDLTGEMNALQGKKAEMDLTGPETERLEQLWVILDDSNKKKQEQEDKFFLGMLSNYKTYAQKREDIIADSEKRIAKFTEAGLLDQAELVRIERDQQLGELNKSTVEGLGGMDVLIEKMDELSHTAQVRGIKAAKETFHTWIKHVNLTEKEVEDLRKVFGKLFKDAETKSVDTLIADMQEVFSVFTSIASDISRVDEEFGKVLGTVADVIGGVIEMGAQIKKVKSDGASFGSFLAIYGAMVKIGFSIFDAINSASEQRWNDQVMARTKQLEQQNELLEYQIALVDTLNGTDKLDQLKKNLVDLQDLVKQTRGSLAGMSMLSGNGKTDSLLSDLNSGKTTVSKLEAQIRSLKTQISNLGFSGSDAALRSGLEATISHIQKTIEFYRTSLKLTGNESIEELIRLSSQVDEETKKKIDSLIEYEKQLKEMGQTISESLLGFSTKSMVDELVSLFSQGKMSAQDFTNSFESMMKKAIINSLSVRFLEKQLAGFYEEFEGMVAKNAESGLDSDSPLTSDNIAELRKKYDLIINDGKKQLDAWSSITGLDFSDQASSGGLTSSGIKTISELSALEFTTKTHSF